jgi:hypothetical protein
MGFPSGLFFVILPHPEFFLNPVEQGAASPVAFDEKNRQHKTMPGGEATKIQSEWEVEPAEP